MKIAILSPFYPYRGGISQLSARFYIELAKTNIVKAFSFSTLYPNFLFPGKTQMVTDSDDATVIDSDRILSSVNPLSYINTAKSINRFGPDILIIPYWMSFLGPALGLVAFFVSKKTKIVALVHNALPHERRFFDKIFAKFFFNKCDAFIVLSEPVKKDLEDLVPNARILLTPHPIYDHYGEKIGREKACNLLNISSEKKNLLFFGLIRDYKGLDLLIEAMSLLDSSYQLIIAGESYGSFEMYQNLINKSPFKDNIKVLEQYVPDEMVTTLFSASDLLVLPYRSATQSGVLAIAYQLETPTLATNVGALGEAVLSSSIGIVTDEINPESIAVSIRSFFSDPEKIKIYQANIKKEKARLSWSNMVEATQSFLNKIA